MVWAKHRNSRYYRAKVQSINDTLFYMITFDDNSFRDDLSPSDIVVSIFLILNFSVRSYYYQSLILLFQNHESGNNPAVGDSVMVKRPDGHPYNGIFEGTNHRIMFTVRNNHL